MAGITFAVSVTFKSKDEQTKNFKRMGKNAKKFGDKTAKAFKKASKSATNFKTIAKGILTAGAIQKTLGGVATGLRVVTTEFLDFDDAITQASAKFGGLNLATKEGQATLEKLKKTAREVGATTTFSAAEAAAALNFYATAGLSANAAMNLLAPTARLALAANLDLARTSDIASDALGIFGLSTKDPIKLGQNFAKMSDQMASTMTSANLTLEQLFETTKTAGGIFRASGQSMATFNAFTRSLADSSIKGEKAGTGLRAFMAKLAKPTKEAQRALDKLGVEIDDGTGGFRDAVDILADFEKGMARLGTKQRLAAIDTVFGIESMTTFTALLATGSEKIRGFRKDIEDSGGATKKMADIMKKSLINRLLGLKSAAIEVGFQLFTAFSDKGGKAINSLTNFIRKIDLKPFIEGIKSVSRFAVEMFNKFVEFGKKTGFFDLIKQSIKDWKIFFVDAFEVAKNSITGTIEAMKPFTGAIAVITGAFVAYKVALIAINIWTKIVAASTLLWNIAMNLNPISIVVIAMIALVAAIVAIVQNWDKVIETLRKVKFISDIMDMFNDFVKIVSEKLVSAFDSMWETAKTIFKNIIDFIEPIVKALGDLAKVIGKSLMAAFEDAWDVVKPILENIKKFIQPIIEGFKPLIKLVGETLANAFEGMWKIVSPILEAIEKFISPVTDFISGIFDGFGGGDGIQKSILESITGLTAEVQAELNLREKRQQEQRGANQTAMESRKTEVDISGRIRIESDQGKAAFTPSSPDAERINFSEMGPVGI